MRTVMSGYVDRGEVPGLVALVARHGDAHVDAIGTMSAGGGEPVQRDTIFRISSMTKPVTAVATMILAEECAVRLDEPVDRLLPELAGRRVLTRLDGPLDDTTAADRPITVRDLLTFCMGIGIVFAAPGTVPLADAMAELGLGQGIPSPLTPPTPDEWLRRLGTLPLVDQPGKRWMYNTGSDVLGVLVARASGQPFERFLAERIFAPLGMADTGFFVPPSKRGRLATSYATNPMTGETGVFDEPAGGQWSQPPSFPSGAAGLVSTVDDYLAFAEMLRACGVCRGQRILSRTSVQAMTTDQLTPAQKAVSALTPGFFDDNGWGFGVSVVTRRTGIAQSPGSYGWNGGLGTVWWNDPAEDLITILMTQQAWSAASPPPICQDFWTLAYQAIDD
ncbi:MAG TPA: serine hydrolase domain-containing protein [Streptosporangiaceae bacterium]